MHFILIWNLLYFSSPFDTLISYLSSYSLEKKSRKSCDKFILNKKATAWSNFSLSYFCWLLEPNQPNSSSFASEQPNICMPLSRAVVSWISSLRSFGPLQEALIIRAMFSHNYCRKFCCLILRFFGVFLHLHNIYDLIATAMNVLCTPSRI